MVADMSYDSVSLVVESWEGIRRFPNYEEKVGSKLFQRFFEADPSAMQVFSFGQDTKLDNDFYKSERFIRHAKYFIQMIERAICLLGPDIELLTKVLLELGEKHNNFGVKPSHYPVMGDSLLRTIEETLGEKYTEDVKAAWLEVYQALAYDMTRGRRRSQLA